MMPVILDPGFVATDPMPESTGTKLRLRPQYLRGRASGKLYFRDAAGTLFEIRELPACQWPEGLRRDGALQMEPGNPDGASGKSAAARHKRYRQRKAAALAAAGTQQQQQSADSQEASHDDRQYDSVDRREAEIGPVRSADPA